MIYHEEKMNLLTVPQGYWIAHCISGDFTLGAGVAKQIDEVFNMKAALKSVWEDNIEDFIGACLPIANVLNLVTKDKYWHKPTLKSLRDALEDMKMIAVENCIKKIAMPRIGCGLDKLNWQDVEPMIKDVFKDMDIEIMVCVL